MENILDYANLLPRVLPTSLVNPLISTLSSAYALLRTLQTHAQPFLARLLSEPDTKSIVLLLVILFVSWQVLGMAYRAVMFWVRLLVRVFVYGSMVAVGLWVYNRGVDGFVDDVRGLVEFGGREYERYSGEFEKYQQMKEREMRRQSRGRVW